MFNVEGYDKDNDVYDLLYTCDTLDQAKKIGTAFNLLCREDRILSSSVNRTPYDWIEIFSHKDEEVVFIF